MNETASVIALNHRRYVAMDQCLEREPGAIRSVWFAAAACVTHPVRGLGALDSLLGRLAFSRSQSAFLSFVHVELFALNTRWFDRLQQGRAPIGLEGVDGIELDHAMVDLEQLEFTRAARRCFGGDDTRLATMMTGLNERFRCSLVLRSRVLAHPLPDALRSLRCRTAFDLASETDRRHIGHYIIDRIHRERRDFGYTSRASRVASNGACTFTSLSK